MAANYRYFFSVVGLALALLAPTGLVAWQSKLHDQCQSHFRQATALWEELGAHSHKREDEDRAIPIIVAEIVTGGEVFLNDCVDPGLPLTAQPERLAELARFSETLPASEQCGFRYQATTEFVDLDLDGREELVLHTQAIRCDFRDPGGGGLSIAFHQEGTGGRWAGNLIWPCWFDACPISLWDIHPQPQVQALRIRDADEQHFMLVAGGSFGGDAWHEELTVFRWDGNLAQPLLTIIVNNWCSNPITWTVSDDGAILVPAASPTYRCEARPSHLFTFYHDRFVLCSDADLKYGFIEVDYQPALPRECPESVRPYPSGFSI